MPSYVLKPRPDRDEYVYWSEVVDGPNAWGTRAEIFEYLTGLDYGGDVSKRMERADEWGSSALWGDPRAYSWQDGDRRVIYQDGHGTVSVWDLWEFCERLDAGEPVDDLIDPFEDWNEDE